MSKLAIGQTLYHSTISSSIIHNAFFRGEMYNQASDAGKFNINVSRRFTFNRLIPRNGEWSTPFPSQLPPGFEMPAFDSNFSLSFSEVTDQKAQEIKQLLANNPELKIGLYYSGGMDSMVVLVSLLKNLSDAELTHLTICMSMDSVVEAPAFFEKYINGKFKIIDLARGEIRYSDLYAQGYYIITADTGDAMFGTEVGTQFYYEYENYCNKLGPESRAKLTNLVNNVHSPETHFSVYADILIQYFDLKGFPEFGRMYYEKLVKNIHTSTVPIYSLHDFFWWVIFNVKWMHCALRGPIFFGESENLERPINEYVINWYNTDDYQRWSMANNNNGQKIQGTTSSTYKWAARNYIRDYLGDDWYFHFKLKLASLTKLGALPDPAMAIDVGMRFGLDSDYNLLRLNDPGMSDYIGHHLATCPMDW